eukprot:CAMPEP_0203872112 /NCGR_PEP_ID=MMETSP0359-20131031/19081_1 /ASSEMBLY_ACC=CAM_ASM_000338 /TAXON_ID=268821 /ORGANISM="Scrippsiella Hangoei, Strain SHTV-5" /LENGTH=101 /DNA_ID=CAMNT_0050790797 /DNA_START=137 /DNA_END=443 /DNA_ORIENTATION=-
MAAEHDERHTSPQAGRPSDDDPCRIEAAGLWPTSEDRCHEKVVAQVQRDDALLNHITAQGAVGRSSTETSNNANVAYVIAQPTIKRASPQNSSTTKPMPQK